METNCGLSDKKGKKPLQGEANHPHSAEQSADSSALEKLAQMLEARPGETTLLELEQLEMLEAELRNQGILPSPDAPAIGLSQHALHSASILRWRARRAGVAGDTLNFRIDVPRYVLSRAKEIGEELASAGRDNIGSGTELLLRRSASWGKGLESPSRLLGELEYLEAFSAYLLGHFDATTNRYQRGLNVVLRILAGKSKGVEPEAKIVLPMEVKDFLEAVRPFRQGAAGR